jgi:hypothetical protein
MYSNWVVLERTQSHRHRILWFWKGRNPDILLPQSILEKGEKGKNLIVPCEFRRRRRAITVD